jgi:hypothetical protein
MSVETPVRPEADLGPETPGAPERESTTSADVGIAAVSPVSAALAAFLATTAAGWSVASVFAGTTARLISPVGGLIGAGMVLLSYRTRRTALVQGLAVPLAALVGGLLVLQDTTGGTANLPSLVVEAITSGGLDSPPVPFDPGWRFLLVVITATLGVASASLAVSFNRPRLSVALAVPLIAGGMLIQPPATQTTSALVALVLAFAALGVSFGAQLGREGATSGGFEMRRMARAAGITTVLVVCVALLSQVGFLFPTPNDSNVIPPKRPQTPPVERDRVIFRVDAPLSVPWRLGTLDVYGIKELAWLTPPYDPKRFVPVSDSGDIPTGQPESVSLDDKGVQVKASFTIVDATGRVIPTLANPTSLRGTHAEFDPRTQSFRLGGRVRSGTKYTVVGYAAPPASVLNQSPAPDKRIEDEYGAASLPAPPQLVRELIARAPKLLAGRYERLQYVRQEFYKKVVAAGAGKPVDVSPARVEQILLGKEASPYEITAAEALLARWAGIPARIGYGYYTGDDTKRSGTVEVRPRDGSTWLEAYFEGNGWVPIVGRPPKAKASTDTNDKNKTPNIKPSDNLAMVVYVPLQVSTVTLLYTLVLYWLARLLPLAGLLLIGYLTYPFALKLLRRGRRRRWASRLGPRARIVVAYSQLRDAANDLGIGHPTYTPVLFLDSIAPDAEARELAWLVSRCVWGDLSRDIRDEDADRCEDMARSVQRRLVRGQTAIARMVAACSRASLRDPYSPEVPNLWPTWPVRAWLRARRRDVLRALGGAARLVIRPLRRGSRLAPSGAASLMLVLVAMLLSGCGRAVDLRSVAPAEASVSPVVPSALDGIVFSREAGAERSYTKLASTSLVTAGRVYSLRQGTVVQGSLQIAWFKEGLGQRRSSAARDILDTFEGGRFHSTKVGGEFVYRKALAGADLLLWFPPGREYYQLMVTRKEFDPGLLFAHLLQFQRGERGAGGTDRGRDQDSEYDDPRLGVDR